MSDGYPRMITPVGHTEPAPRRVRAVLDGRVVVDTLRAVYVWEFPPYPQYYIPADDVSPGVLTGENGKLHTDGKLAGLVRFEWGAFDAWFEEDEQIFVHPRNPYARVDALRATRHVRIELEGVRLAESHDPVLLFETGLPTRYYLNRTEVDFAVLEHSETETQCPYKGRTTDYWSVRTPAALHTDLAWSYSFPLPAVQAIAGLICFYNEKVDIVLDGRPLPRPLTSFS